MNRKFGCGLMMEERHISEDFIIIILFCCLYGLHHRVSNTAPFWCRMHRIQQFIKSEFIDQIVKFVTEMLPTTLDVLAVQI